MIAGVRIMSTKGTTVFGNRLSRTALWGTNISYKLCRLQFGIDKKTLELAAVKRGEVYKDFGVMTLVDKNSETAEEKFPIDEEHGIVLGTMRMGFGHWRMTIAMASAAHDLGYTGYLLDLKSFDGTVAKKSINFLERWYNLGSRLSQLWKWFDTHVWERLTSQGGTQLSSAVRERNLSRLFVPVFKALPKNIPFISAHPWVGHGAVLAGLERVTSIVPDNFPMAFWLVEGSKHCVQSPSAYMGYRTLIGMENRGNTISHCVPKADLICSGHYVDHELVSNVENDCARRLERYAEKEPRRFLLTMGGAGAQVERFADIAHVCKHAIQNAAAALFINMGDHRQRCTLLQQYLSKDGIAFTVHDNWEESKRFVNDIKTGHAEGVHLFIHDDFYAAVYATNLLMRVCDVMVTKPSELSYYPIPKLFIQRVGKHEAWGAIRSSEIGDGTMEAGAIPALHRTLKALIEDDDLIKLYCAKIVSNMREGVYNGAYIAVKTATRLH